MITTFRSALSTFGGAVDRLFHHDSAGVGVRHDDNGAKRLKLSIPAVVAKTEEDEKDVGNPNLPDGLPDYTLDEYRQSRVASPRRHGGNSLPSPPSSPRKHDTVRQPASKARRFLNKFRLNRDTLGFEPEDVSSTSSAILSSRAILKERRRIASRQAPKRLGRTKLPMSVRFTETTKRYGRPKPVGIDLPALQNLTLHTEPIASTPAERRFADRLLSPPPEEFDYIPTLAKTRLDAANPDECIDAILNEKQPWALKISSSVGETIEAQRKSQVSDEEITREHITNMNLYDIRAPRRPLLITLSDEIKRRTTNTIYASPTAVLGKAADSTPLRRHDFCRVIPHQEWLNDEIVNGVLSWLDQAVNHIGGVDDYKAQTRKCLVMTSFYYTQIKTACKNTQRTLKRKGVTKENLLKVNTILLPICEHSHWTLMVINPSKRTVAHVDSLNPRGTKSVTDLALRWMQDALDERFIPAEWSTVKYNHPAQTNGYDCGVHTICNAISVAVGINALDAYRAIEMPELRVQMSAVLVNGGFTGELDLLGL